MTSSRRRIIIVLVLALVGTSVVLAPEASAQTTVTVDGTIVTITVPLDFIGLRKTFRDPETGETLDTVATIEAGVEGMWNEAFDQYRYADCFTLRLDLQVTALPGGSKGSDGHHAINVWNDPTIRPRVTLPGDNVRAEDDWVNPFQYSASGEWGPFYLPTAAHEVGHLIGLGDDYTDVGGTYSDVRSIPLPGREGTLMGDGDTIDQNLVDRIGDVLRKVVDLPECWTGSVDVDAAMAGGGTTCFTRWEGTMTLVVAADRSTKGDWRIALVDGPTCTLPEQQTNPLTSFGFPVSGQREADRFTLEAGTPTELTVNYDQTGILGSHFRANEVGWVPRPFELAITGPGVVDTQLDLSFTTDPGAFTITETIALVCPSCTED